ncbi:MAG: hypothetical protein JWQ18_2409 [Conexibacter sp.]|nr:hypothetical protein [Conexibacter sp.]
MEHEHEHERQPRWVRHGPGAVLLVAVIAIIGAFCAMAYHGECTDPGPPVDVPEPGSPRGKLCAAIPPGSPWLLVLVPVVLVGALAYLRGPERRTTLALGVLAVAAQVALPTWAATLQFASTI